MKTCKDCIDGDWGDWEAWSQCSAECAGGTTTRTRVESPKANACGTPAYGKDEETGFCNLKTCTENKDCEMSLWTEWTACSSKCDGQSQRERQQLTVSSGQGNPCFGSSLELRACNPFQNDEASRPDECKTPPPQDCKLTEFGPWSECSAVCGGGQQTRQREITQAAKNGGAPCPGGVTLDLRTIQECNHNITCPDAAPVNCKLGEWEDWSVCDKVTSDRTRWKKIATPETNGGTCDVKELQELEQCTYAGPKTVQFCDWVDWKEWTACSVKCGSGGFRERERAMVLKSKQEKEEVSRKLGELVQDDAELEALRRRAQELQAQGPSEFIAAFLAGAAALLVLLVGTNAIVGRFHRSSPSTYSDEW